MTVVLTADKVLQIMDILRDNPNSLRRVPPKTVRDTTPVRMLALTEVLTAGVPLVYTITVDGHNHRLRLPEGFADSECPGLPVVSPYNAALKALGNKAVLAENAPYSEVCRAHVVIHNRVHKGTLPVPEGTTIREEATAEAVSTPEEAKPVKAATKEPIQRPYVWVKNGVEERITEKMWEQRVRMCGGLRNVPIGSGQVEMLHSDIIDPIQLLQDGDEVEIEWDQDIPYIVEINPGADDEPLVAVVQKPVADAPAKYQPKAGKKAKKKAAQQAEKMDLTTALAVLAGSRG